MAVTEALPAPGESESTVSALAARRPPTSGARVRLPGRGEIFVREARGPEGAPTVVLLHGWIASGGLNWFHTLEQLGHHFRVLAPDLRGHGRGVRGTFRLAHCADDVAALLRVLDTGPVIAAGYSMGGPVAQLLWRRHREQVAGLVLCATSHAPIHRPSHRRVFGTMMSGAIAASRALSRTTSAPRAAVRMASASSPVRLRRPRTMRSWTLFEMGRHDWTTILEAGQELARYDAGRWIRHVDVPTAVVVTERDRAIRPDQQRHMATRIPDATVHPYDDGHLSCMRPEFAGAVARACHDVANRARGKAAALEEAEAAAAEGRGV